MDRTPTFPRDTLGFENFGGSSFVIDSATPRPYEQWRKVPPERAEDAAYTFAYNLMQHCRSEGSMKPVLLSPSQPRNLKVSLFIPVLLFVVTVCAQTTVPDTPAGKTLRTWLDAFNSGDRAKLEAYIKTFDPQQSVERMMSFHNQTGGFDLITIESSEPLLIKFRVK